MMKKTLVLILFFLFFQLFCYADINENQKLVNYSVNWESHKFIITIKDVLPVSKKSLPSLKSIIENKNKQDLPYTILYGIQELTIDSKTKGSDYITEHPNTIEAVFGLAPEFTKTSSLFSLDFKSIVTTYSINIYPDIAALFISHSRTTNLMPNLDFVASASFSGIVIYVDSNLPLYGKHSTGNFSPSLFPKVYNEKLNLIADPFMVNPEIIKKEGTVGYQTSTKTLDLARIGQTPLKIKARGIFGINNTDLIISTRDAEKITSRIENLELIKQGKILIIYNSTN